MDETNRNFIKSCADAANCGCVVANAHISGLLKALAASPAYMRVVRAAAKNYDFVTEFNRSKVPTGTGGFRLLPPVREEEFAAYAFGILLHVDLGDLDLIDLMNCYFSDASFDMNAAYLRFGAAVIDRFCRTVTGLAGQQEAAREADAKDAEGRRAAAKQLLTECASAISVSGHACERKEEIAVLCAALLRALAGEYDRDTLRALGIGLRYASVGLCEIEAKVRSVLILLRRIAG